MDVTTIAGLAFFVAICVLILIVALAKRYVKVGPNQVLVVTGKGEKITNPDGTRERLGYRIVKGGGTFVLPIIERFELLSLELLTLEVSTPEVYTSSGVPIIVDGVAQIKVKGDDISIRTASERFLSKGRKEVETIALQTLEGHLRAILGQMTVEDIYRNRDEFAQKVQEVAATDMANMGLSIDSFTLRDIRDNHGYLEALGKPRTAQVKRDAIIAQAEADRDATIRAAKARQEGEQAKFIAQTEVARAERDYQIQKADYDKSSNAKKAEADLAYDLQKFKTEQEVRAQAIQVQVIEKEKSIEVQEKEILRRERELDATIRKPAEAEQYRVKTLAEAEQFRLETEAKGRAGAKKAQGFADADVTKVTGEAEASASKARGIATADVNRAQGLAEADVVRAQGEAEALAMSKKADSWANYNEAAILQLFMEVLPQIAESVAKPLSNIDRMVVINSGNGKDGGGASKITQDVTNVMAQLPPIIEALSGVDMSKLLERVPGLKAALSEARARHEIPEPQPPVQPVVKGDGGKK